MEINGEMTVTCPICKEILYGFEWKKTINEANWMQNEQGEWHNCPMNQKYQPIKYKLAIKQDFVKCELCPGYFLIKDYDYHLKIIHPNNEILTEKDWECV